MTKFNNNNNKTKKDTFFFRVTLNNMKRPVYRLAIDEMTEGMDFMALVDSPAHGKSWTTMSKVPRKIKVKTMFNSEKQVVTGVAIATNLLIYRRDPDGYEYDVYLSKQDTFEIMKKFAKGGYHNNVNLMHDAGMKVHDAYMIESYFVWDNKQNIPEAFKDQNLQPGSLIFSYWIESKDTWNFVKEHGTGFSLEGWFNQIPVKFLKENQKSNKMSEKKKSLFERLGFGTSEPKRAKYDAKHKYAEAVNTDGDTVQWDGDLAEGLSIFVVPAEGEPILAPEGEMTIDMDGEMILIRVDENGLITSVEGVVQMANVMRIDGVAIYYEGTELVEGTALFLDEEMTEPAPDGPHDLEGGISIVIEDGKLISIQEVEEEELAEVEEAMKAMRNEYETKFSAQKDAFEGQVKTLASEIEELREAVERLSEQKEAKKAKSTHSGGLRALRN